MANEKRLIDANALKAEFPVTGNFKDDLWHSATVRVAIDNAPTVDAVEVVRCKDCKHLTVYNSPTLYAYCQKTHLRFEPFQEDTRTHFCSYGERRTNERTD